MGSITANVVLTPLLYKAASVLYQKQEYGADRFSIERPCAAFSKEKLVLGASEIFLKFDPSLQPYSLIEKHFDTHPHSRDRLRALSFPEQASSVAREKILSLLRHEFVLMLCLLKKQNDEIVWESEQALVEVGQNIDLIEKNHSLCSIHPHIEIELIPRLNDLKKELITFSQDLQQEDRLEALDNSFFDLFELLDRDRLKERIFDSSGEKRTDCAPPTAICNTICAGIDTMIDCIQKIAKKA